MQHTHKAFTDCEPLQKSVDKWIVSEGATANCITLGWGSMWCWGVMQGSWTMESPLTVWHASIAMGEVPASSCPLPARPSAWLGPWLV